MGKACEGGMSYPDEDFQTNVFINCPFDSDYIPLLRPLLFTVLFLGYNPRIASESCDSGEARIGKICNLIQCSKHSIHDISRIQSFLSALCDSAVDFFCCFRFATGSLNLGAKILQAQPGYGNVSTNSWPTLARQEKEMVSGTRTWDSCLSPNISIS
jgi:hypothetical protein